MTYTQSFMTPSFGQ